MVEEAKTTKETKARPKAEKPTAKKADNFAVIKTGGKQYVVWEGLKLDVEKLEAEEGKSVDFAEVLLVANGSDVKLGTPVVEGSKVTGKVVSQFKDDKVMVFKYKPKKRYRKTYGHRQQLTKVEITKIA